MTPASGPGSGTWGYAYLKAIDRGFFFPRTTTRFRDVTDGLANTIALGEILTGDGSTEANCHLLIATSVTPNPTNAHRFPPRSWDHLLNQQSPRFWQQGLSLQGRRGTNWALGRTFFTGFTTALAPNSPAVGRAVDRQLYASTGSRHVGGCHVMMGDGAVRFITDSIEAGNQRGQTPISSSNYQPGTPSPMGLWGQLGTKNTKEVIQGLD